MKRTTSKSNKLTHAKERKVAADPQTLGQQIVLQLKQTTHVTQVAAFDTDLIVDALRANVLSLPEALQIDRLKSDPAEQANVLLAIAAHYSENERTSFLEEIWQAIGKVRQSLQLASLLWRFIELFPGKYAAEVFAIAQSMPYDWLMTDIVRALGEHLSPTQLAQVLQSARALDDGWSRFSALMALVRYLPEPERSQIIEEALRLAYSLGANHDPIPRPEEMIALRVPDGTGYRKVPLRIRGENVRVEALIELWPLVPTAERGKVLTEALAEARRISWVNDRLVKIVKVANLYPLSDQTAILEEAVAAIDPLKAPVPYKFWLIPLALKMPENIRIALIQKFWELILKHNQGETISASAPWLPPELIKPAYEMAQSFKYEPFRTCVMLNILTRLPKEEQRNELDRIVRETLAIPSSWSRAIALATLLAQTPATASRTLLGREIATAAQITDIRARGEALLTIADQLPDDVQLLLRDEKSAAQSVRLKYRDCRKEVDHLAQRMIDLAEQIPTTLQQAIFAQTLAQLPEWPVPAIGPYLIDPVVARVSPAEHEALFMQLRADIQAQLNLRMRAQLLFDLLAFFPKDEHDSLWRKILTLCHQIRPMTARVQFLEQLAQSLPDNLVSALLDIARHTTQPRQHALMLLAITPRLVDPEKSVILIEAIDAARAIDKPRSRTEMLRFIQSNWGTPSADVIKHLIQLNDQAAQANALSAIAQHLPASEQRPWCKHALRLTRAIQNEASRAEALTTLAGRAPESLLGEILTEVSSLHKAEWRGVVLGAISSRLTGADLEQAIMMARQIGQRALRARVLGALAKQAPAVERRLIRQEALTALAGVHDARTFIWALRTLPSPIPEQIWLQVLESIADTATTYRAEALGDYTEALRDEVTPRVWQRILEVAHTIGNASFRWCTLTALIRWLPETERTSVVAEALVAAREIWWDMRARVRALSELSTWLPEPDRFKVLIEASGWARSDQLKAEHRVEAWVDLLPHLPAEQRGEIAVEALKTAVRISGRAARLRGVEMLIRWLPDRGLWATLEQARLLRKEPGATVILASIAPRWSAMCAANQCHDIEELTTTLSAFGETDRSQFLNCLAALANVIEQQSGQPTLYEIAQAIATL